MNSKPGPDPAVAAAVVRALRTYSGAVDTYVESMRHAHEMHRTDLSALAVVMDRTARGESVTPREIGRAINLSTSATSAMLDRLERVGHVRRLPHPEDRRSVVIEITDSARRAGRDIFGRLGAATEAVMANYTDDELRLVTRFLDDVARASLEARP
ncbi:MarR family winged helix-turn-helix transcriptional regulator [Nocardioides sp. MAHUQ-72]|uniref:MarR family winged helix-turn-helix transcriptional regulator n=1 Tax=unclassified Nocardioides TaxID=2615069 RepID=UPI003609389C